jgi:glycosyltransferase involved in cell wall biosynthesis
MLRRNVVLRHVITGSAMARITFLLPELTLNGGVRVVVQYGVALMALGHDVRFVGRRTPASPLREVLRGRMRFSLGGTGRTDFFAGLEDRLTLFSAYRPLRPRDLPDADFLVATWWETVEWITAMPASKGRHVHLMQHYEMFDWLPKDRVRATYERDGLLRISVSGWIADQVLRHHGKASAAVIPNAVDTDHFRFAPATENPCLTLGFMYARPPFKNAALVLALRDALRARGLEVRYHCLSAEDDVSAVTGKPDITLHHKPKQADIPAIYQGCDLWLFPSLEEGFGLPILEAMACGTPVIGTPAGAAPDLIVDGVNGYQCGWDMADFLAAIDRFLALSAPARTEMRVQARKGAEGQSWDKAAQDFLAALGV